MVESCQLAQCLLLERTLHGAEQVSQMTAGKHVAPNQHKVLADVRSIRPFKQTPPHEGTQQALCLPHAAAGHEVVKEAQHVRRWSQQPAHTSRSTERRAAHLQAHLLVVTQEGQHVLQ
jgi:hypothetical protein